MRAFASSRLGLKPLVLALLLPLGLFAAAPAKDEPITKLDPMRVNETPLAKWGIAISTKVSLVSRLTGQWAPPREAYLILGVWCNSPADRAGLRSGEEIIAVNGIGYTKLPLKDFLDIFDKSKSGDTVTLLLHHFSTNQQRTVTLKLDSGRKWLSDDRSEFNVWGLKVVIPSVNAKGRIEREWPVQRCTFEWGGKALTIIEHPGLGLELIDGTFSTRNLIKRQKAKGEPTGRMVPPGTTLTLKPNGEYEVVESSEPSAKTPSDAKVREE